MRRTFSIASVDHGAGRAARNRCACRWRNSRSGDSARSECRGAGAARRSGSRLAADGRCGADRDRPGQAAADEETIVVTGLRRSLQSAQNIKRNSEQIVDAIVAEDIGKLPDIAVSDTAARIPGVQVERARRRGGQRAAPRPRRELFTTTYNGREIFTAETRSVALQDFPAGGIAAIEVFKTSTANLVEPGLAGLINVRSRRPFDFKGFEIAGSVWASLSQPVAGLEPNAQMLVSNRWDVGDGEFGALINFSYTRLHYQDSIRRHGFFVADLRRRPFARLAGDPLRRGRPQAALGQRRAAMASVADIELYVEGLWQGYREKVTDAMWAQPLWSCGDAATECRLSTTVPMSSAARSPIPAAATARRPRASRAPPSARRTPTIRRRRQATTPARLRISADLARTSSTFNLRAESIDYELNTNNYSVDWFTGLPGRIRADVRSRRASTRRTRQLQISRLLRGSSDRQGRRLAGPARFRI